MDATGDGGNQHTSSSAQPQHCHYTFDPYRHLGPPQYHGTTNFFLPPPLPPGIEGTTLMPPPHLAGSFGPAMQPHIQQYHPYIPPAPMVRGTGSFSDGRRGRGHHQITRGRRSDPLHWQDDAAAVQGKGCGRGRGCGQGGWMGLAHHSSDKRVLDVPSATDAPEPISNSEFSSRQPDNQPEALLASSKISVQQNVIPPGATPFIPWCDICRVMCTGRETFELHMNGKRHKKTVQSLQQFEAQHSMIAGYQNGRVSASSGSAAVSVLGCNQPQVARPPAEGNVTNLGTPVASNDGCAANLNSSAINPGAAVAPTVAMGSYPAAYDNMHPLTSEGQQSKTIDETRDEIETSISGTPLAEASASVQQYGLTVNGSKRSSTKSGRGGNKRKKVGTFPWMPVRIKEQPIVCTLCSVTCDTAAVFDIHLAGKKHISRVKRFQGQNMVFGPVYIPANQPSTYPPDAPVPRYFGLTTHTIGSEMLMHPPTQLGTSDGAVPPGQPNSYGVAAGTVESLAMMPGTVASESKDDETAGGPAPELAPAGGTVQEADGLMPPGLDSNAN